MNYRLAFTHTILCASVQYVHMCNTHYVHMCNMGSVLVKHEHQV
jgi:hypothetical protein